MEHETWKTLAGKVLGGNERASTPPLQFDGMQLLRAFVFCIILHSAIINILSVVMHLGRRFNVSVDDGDYDDGFEIWINKLVGRQTRRL